MHTDTVLSFFVYNLKFKDANVFVAFSRGADTSPQTPCTLRNSRTFLRSELLIAPFAFSLASCYHPSRPLQAEAETGIHAGNWFPTQRKNWIPPSGH